jgi:hypothetical protein
MEKSFNNYLRNPKMVENPVRKGNCVINGCGRPGIPVHDPNPCGKFHAIASG